MPPDWSDWWWSAIGNGVGGVFTVLALGLLVQSAIWLIPFVEAVAEVRAGPPGVQLLLWSQMGLTGTALVASGVVGLRTGGDAGTLGLVVAVIALVVSMITTNSLLIVRALRALERRRRQL